MIGCEGMLPFMLFIFSIHRDVEIFLDMAVIYTDFENFVRPNNEIFSQNETLSVKSSGLTICNITVFTFTIYSYHNFSKP